MHMQTRPGPAVSIIVPALDEEQTLTATLDRLALLPGDVEVVVADGGSRDGTLAAARGHPSRPLVLPTSPPGRGRGADLNVAARLARGQVLLFLHADTRLPLSAAAILAAALREPAVVGGNFEVRFEGRDRLSCALTRLYAVLRGTGIYYGDSAIFVRAHVFRRLGGFRELPVMEDYDFVRRLEKAGRTVCLPGPVVPSSRRWRGNGAVRTVGAWLLLQTLFTAGVPAQRLAALYPPAR